jgi:hypothetical protein
MHAKALVIILAIACIFHGEVATSIVEEREYPCSPGLSEACANVSTYICSPNKSLLSLRLTIKIIFLRLWLC